MEIRCSEGTYPIEAAESLDQAIRGSRPDVRSFHVLMDESVAELYPEASAGVAPERLTILPANEEGKSFAALEPLLHRLVASGLKRNGTLIVVGGGVLQDIGCFLASVLYRGIAWEFVPTTLLAQCDSCIGGKSSINLGKLKNQVGTFHPPKRVQLVFRLLRTLPEDEIRSGLGEIIKLHWVDGEDAFSALAERLPELWKRPDELPPIILRALEIKKRFIEADEFDTGIRNLLNYGHTFGHAYEAVTDYRIPHGVAVTLGMATAIFVSERLGLVSENISKDADRLLSPYYTPYEEMLERESVGPILAAMKSDKKSTGDLTNFILTRGPGRMEKRSMSADRDVAPLLGDFLLSIRAAR